MSGSMHLQNARMWTADVSRPWAGSMTIQDGRIIAIDADLPPRFRGEVVDAQGRFVVPGLIDSHLHLLQGGLSLTQLDLSAVRSRAEFERAIAQRHAELPRGEWLLARSWSQDNWKGELPTNDWLRAAGDRPCVCYRMDMHAAVVNEAVMKMLDLRVDPVGGKVVRRSGADQVARRSAAGWDVAGEPTGLLLEAAAWKLLNPIIPQPSSEHRRRALLAAQTHAHAHGLTMVGSMEYCKELEEVFATAHEAGELTLRCRCTQLDRSWPMNFDFARRFTNDDVLAVIGCKAFIDGTLGSRSARMLKDYCDDPGNRGLFVELAAEGHLLAWAQAVAGVRRDDLETGCLSPSMHAIGDEAARLALDVLDELERHRRAATGVLPRHRLPTRAATVRERATDSPDFNAHSFACRPRIEHAQQLDLSDIPRFKGRIASMQPLHKADDARGVESRLGKDRLTGTFAFRKLKNAGAILAFGSDWPVVSLDPMVGIRAAVTGLTLDGRVFGADQNLTVEEALLAYTRDAAYALQAPSAGVLKVGGGGDFTMLDIDPFTIDWSTKQPRVELAVANGEYRYAASDCSRTASG